MLRSLDLLRQTAPPSSLIADGNEHLALVDGSVDYAKPWHWHDGLMLLLPWVGVLNLKHEERREGAWVTDDRFAVVPATHAHDTSAYRSNQSHIAVYIRDGALRRVEAQVGSLSRVRALIGTSAMFPVTPEIRTLHALCREETRDAVGRAAVRTHLSAALLIRCLGAIEQGQALSASSRRGQGASRARGKGVHRRATESGHPPRPPGREPQRFTASPHPPVSGGGRTIGRCVPAGQAPRRGQGNADGHGSGR